MNAKTVKNVIYLRSADNEFTANVNCYNGKSYLTIFQKDSPVPLSIWMSDTVKYFIKKYLKQIIKDNKPEVNNTIVISNFNQDTKTFDKSAILSIGSDSKGLIYIGTNIIQSSNRKTNDAIANKNIIFTFEIPKAIDISSETFDDVQRNHEAAKVVLDILSNKLETLEIATLETDLDTIKLNANNMNNNNITSNNETDILF